MTEISDNRVSSGRVRAAVTSGCHAGPPVSESRTWQELSQPAHHSWVSAFDFGNCIQNPPTTEIPINITWIAVIRVSNSRSILSVYRARPEF